MSSPEVKPAAVDMATDMATDAAAAATLQRAASVLADLFGGSETEEVAS